MEISNAQEYHSIRSEMQNLKNCLTNYFGFVLGGFGISFFGFNILEKYTGFYNIAEPIAFTSLILAITITMVLQIIFYKFNSHNRFAGYCKLLNQEQLNINHDMYSEIDIMSWEICVTRLRETELEDNKLSGILKYMVMTDIIDEETKKKTEAYLKRQDEFSFKKLSLGIMILIKYMLGSSKTKSWHFPLPVTSVFFSLSVIYIVFSLYTINRVYPIQFSNITFELNSSLMYVILLIMLIFMWAVIFMKLHGLVDGNHTVDAYCCKFLPIRYSFIYHKSIDIEYSLITLKDIMGKSH